MRQEKKTGGTKRALLTSVLAIVLCLVMLMGSTFAWFTDTASTSVNSIVSGTLDVGLEYWGVGENGEKTWLTAEDAKDLFDKNALWEPGYTQIVYLKVKNNGNLALNYAMQITPVHEQVGINVDGNEFKLSDYIQFGWAEVTATEDGSFTPFADRTEARTAVGTGVHLGESLHRQVTQEQEDGTKVPVPLAAGAEELVALVAWMPEEVGNEANYRDVAPSIELTLKVLATQATVESDSIDNTYDAAAVTDEGLDSNPEYNYSYTEEEGVTLITDENGNVVKVIISGDKGKVPEGLLYNWEGGQSQIPMEKWIHVEEVVIEEGVTVIGKNAFIGCANLKTVTLPESLKTIGQYAFAHCTSLETIEIPDGVKEIGEKAFFFCTALSSVRIPESVTEISRAAFAYAESLTTVEFPSNLTKIGDFAFQNCGFTSMDVPATVKELGEGAFSTCRSLKEVTVTSETETIGKNAFYFCDSLKNITISEGVKTIGEEAFRQCSSLESITIPSTVTDLGTCIFKNCFALKEAVIKGGTVKGSFSTDATFYQCSSLNTLIISENAMLDESFRVGSSKDSLQTVKIGKGVIGNSAFSNCTNLTTVELGDGVTSIGTNAFLKCTQLPSITIGSSVTSIGTNAFNGCTALTKAEIKSGVIGESAFKDCTSLADVTLGDGVTAIGKNAFLRCAALAAINIGSSVKTIAAYAFSNCTALEEVYIAAAQVENQAFKSANALKKVTLGDEVTSIPAGAFSYCGMGNKNNSPQLFLKAGDWTCGDKTYTVKAGEAITSGNAVFNGIVSNKNDATWSAPANP